MKNVSQPISCRIKRTSMSASVLRRALELFSDGQEDESEQTKNSAKQVSTSRKGVKKKLNKMKSGNKQLSQRRKFKCALDEYKKHNQDIDHTQDNLQYYQLMSDLGKTDDTVTQTILENREKRTTKTKVPREENVQESIFSDRDFEQFEEEYDFFS